MNTLLSERPRIFGTNKSFEWYILNGKGSNTDLDYRKTNFIQFCYRMGLGKCFSPVLLQYRMAKTNYSCSDELNASDC